MLERGRVLVACVGNILRGDDGFGPAVERHLTSIDGLPAGVDVIETGIGGMAIVQQLMLGYETLIVVDAVDQGAPPGTVLVLEPAIPDPTSIDTDQWREQFSNLHLAEPSRVFLLARALGVLPERVHVVGCQPLSCEDFSQQLSPPVQSAVELAARRVLELARQYAPAAGTR
ncbi:MAG: hydrogenase maturation protease [Chloroflexota bacterium]|nr:hydrogenase maturation protease [Chloroflexota bacterium]